jgi:hypothetical protein
MGQDSDAIERLLDLALEATFPASDPICLSRAAGALTLFARPHAFVHEAAP